MMTQWVSKEAPFTLPEISEATSASTREPSGTGFPTLTLVILPLTSMRRSPSIMVASPFLGSLVIKCLLLLLLKSNSLLPRFPRRVVARQLYSGVKRSPTHEPNVLFLPSQWDDCAKLRSRILRTKREGRGLETRPVTSV